MARHFYEFYIHGVNTHVQDEPNRADDIRRNSQGIRIRQNSGENWFHIAVLTAGRLKDHRAKYDNVKIRGEINNKAFIKSIHVYHGGRPRADRIYRKDYDRGDWITNQSEMELHLSLDDANCTKPIVVCIKAEFQQGGEIYIGEANARFIVAPRFFF